MAGFGEVFLDPVDRVRGGVRGGVEGGNEKEKGDEGFHGLKRLKS